jgi:hypothetical protein
MEKVRIVILMKKATDVFDAKTYNWYRFNISFLTANLISG